jgi:hypothetical protein
MASVTWVGSGAEQQRQSYSKLNRGVIEYVETWRGNPADGAWPAYTIGTTISPTVAGVALGALVWYDISVQSPARGPVNEYTAKASNKFDDNKSEWVLDSTLEGYSLGTLGGVSAYYWSKPSVRKVSYHISAPITGTIGINQTPVPPFTLPTVTFPTIAGITFLTHGWVKVTDTVASSGQVWVRTQGWSFQLPAS